MRARTTPRCLSGRRLLALPLLLAGGLALAGCQAAGFLPPAAIAATVEGVSLNASGKTASDHLVSAITGEDCSVLCFSLFGFFCLSFVVIAANEARLHRPYQGFCFLVRGNVACYDQADATHTSETTVYSYQP